ncbi:UBP-type zinc finger domain-containing protein [Adhaeribacter rhizoryzae]|uniref:UBP-type zinc finger domain-containing protein n=1 Tax=Adhaeribacter rhizoryzae TaxID=2607907 RepID=A0A5M6D0L5_9BACT|nr:UBP-type zinc finger domain-containing protein [Adhaeribacter rhizoryzae]KAA5540596.1 UBP-type zinc finger domain-containing protein [Adhaeribacter rhizoryzae]
MTITAKTCIHLPQDQEIKKATAYQCDECVATGSTWVHLRTCQTCGKTHCCDSSPNKHATKHYHRTGHPVVTSAEPREAWAWCYPDNLFMPLE